MTLVICMPIIHSKLCNITHVANKVHVILHSYVVLTWMRDIRELMLTKTSPPLAIFESRDACDNCCKFP